jgi:hypothetical protein
VPTDAVEQRANGERECRIKSANEPHERVARESESRHRETLAEFRPARNHVKIAGRTFSEKVPVF